MSQPLISLEHVSLSFNDSKLITDLTWHIKKDQHWAVVGPTGSGKSSLAKIINRNIIPDQGRVKYYFDDRIEGSPFFQSWGNNHYFSGSTTGISTILW